MVMLTVGVTVASAEAVSIKQGHGFVMRPVIAGFVLGAMLLLVYSVDSRFGTAFALLVLVGVLLRNGSTLFGAASSAVAKKK